MLVQHREKIGLQHTSDGQGSTRSGTEQHYVPRFVEIYEIETSESDCERCTKSGHVQGALHNSEPAGPATYSH